MTFDITQHPMITTEQWEKFTDTDHHTWGQLFQRQCGVLQDRVTPEVIQGIEKLSICDNKIPKFSELNRLLMKETRFSIVPVTGLIPEDLFFKLLSQRKFPSTGFIRKPHQLDYLEEPDMFHDIFGHVPLLTNPVFADFMQLFGLKGLEALEKGYSHLPTTLYWFTVEFGLINTRSGVRIYGAGITSSKGESIYSLDSPDPIHQVFDLHQLLHTPFRTDVFQKNYFIIDSFEQLFDAVNNLCWEEMAQTVKSQTCD